MPADYSTVYITATVKYRCNRAGGRFEYTTETISFTTRQQATEADYYDEVYQQAQLQAPPRCSEVSVTGLTVTDSEGITPGEEIGVRGKVAFRCGSDPVPRWREYVVNWPGGTTLGEVLADMEQFGQSLVNEEMSHPNTTDTLQEDCVYVGATIIAPAYWAMSTGI